MTFIKNSWQCHLHHVLVNKYKWHNNARGHHPVQNSAIQHEQMAAFHLTWRKLYQICRWHLLQQAQILHLDVSEKERYNNLTCRSFFKPKLNSSIMEKMSKKQFNVFHQRSQICVYNLTCRPVFKQKLNDMIMKVYGCMLFNATFNNISIISWRSVLLLNQSILENHWLVVSHWQTLLHNIVSSTPCHELVSNSQL